MTTRILVGDALTVLRTLPSESVHMCVTSPPYYGLRDYGVPGQIGLEATPELWVAAMVDVFREVRRVLRADGTVWLNIGDSYAASGKGPSNSLQADASCIGGRNTMQFANGQAPNKWLPIPSGLKPKDLIGIPWALAKALRDPYYAGRITAERDRVWLAAMIDGEGSICGYDQIRKDDGSPRTGLNVTITNSSMRLLDEAQRIWPASRHYHNAHGVGHLGLQPTYRWIAHGIADQALLMRELYPYLIAKRNQALLAYNLLELMAVAKKLGHSPQMQATRDKRSLLISLMSRLNHGEQVDVPSWCVSPPSMLEDGWYLRSEIIWSKPNPMPESVTDRPTKAHEQLFLLSKSRKYYYDADAIREAQSESTVERYETPFIDRYDKAAAGGYRGAFGGKNGAQLNPAGRNKRSVWTVATEAFPESHFATYPTALIEPCIKAGCPEGGTVLDPFGGAGTSALVAERLGRNAILIELNPEYARMAERRINGEAPMFSQVSVSA